MFLVTGATVKAACQYELLEKTQKVLRDVHGEALVGESVGLTVSLTALFFKCFPDSIIF